MLRRGITEALNALGAQHGCPPPGVEPAAERHPRRHPDPRPGGPGEGPPPLLDEWTLTGWIELFGLSPLPSQAGSGLQRWGGVIEEGYRVEMARSSTGSCSAASPAACNHPSRPAVAVPALAPAALSVARGELRGTGSDRRQGSAATMSTITDSPAMVDEWTRSMVEVDAAAARAALADRLQLADVDLEHPAAVAVLAAVVAAGWRPPTRAGGYRILTDPAEDPHDPTLFGDSGGITAAAGAPPGRCP